jgi:hypothetical protein
MVRRPLAGLSVFAAATNIAHVRPQGRNPARRPSPAFDLRLPESINPARLLPNADVRGERRRAAKRGVGSAPKTIRPKPIRMIPEAVAKPALYCIENLCTSKDLKNPAMKAPSIP